jgi:hypothetical protein
MLRRAFLSTGSWATVRNGGMLRSSFPSGPATVRVRRGIRRYVVGSATTKGSPRVNSTPGGIEMGVRPSFDALFVVVEKGEAEDRG